MSDFAIFCVCAAVTMSSLFFAAAWSDRGSS